MGNGLFAALNTLPQGFALYDAERRLVMCNRHFQTLFRLSSDLARPGTPAAHHGQALATLLDHAPPENPAASVERAHLSAATTALPVQLPGGRWVQINPHRVHDDHTLIVITDVTALKAQETQRREQALAEKSKLLQMTVDHLGQGLSVFDNNLNIVVWNDRFFDLMGFPRDLKQRPATFEEMVRYNASRGEYGPGDVETQVTERVALARRPVPHHFERVRPNGTALEIRGNPLPDGGFVTIYSDITERKRIDEQLRLAATVLDTANEGIAITDARYRIHSVNPAFLRLTGFQETELIGRKPYFLNVGGRLERRGFRELRRALAGTGSWQGEVSGRRKNGEPFVAWLSLAAIQNASGQVSHYVSVSHDITLSKEDQERIWHQANFDLLTGLPNRYLFMDRLEQAVAQAHRADQRFALLFLDLDGFKAVNDTYGHAAGDELLRIMGRRLSHCIRASDTLARLAGDEFTALFLNLHTHDQALCVAEKFLRVMAMPVVLESGTVTVHASIGIAIYPRHGDNAETLLQQADAAMYEAKRQGKNRCHLAAGHPEYSPVAPFRVQ
jgi:diguanylate cyclase (GGDEF)-like protein/PAS domain S-box-containing protein